ncbi:MBOAT family O-acyltransferase [Flavobacterium sp.]|uniref:MBOAT family O-acyltransferase n=1 Tax=Flavobacterium sp. TaxID=239 RepID=UPI002FD8ECE9
MLFNSLSFAFFLPIVFFLYWFVTNRSLKMQNILLLVSSYFFYACWDTRFLFLLIFSTLLDYFTGLKMTESENAIHRKIWFWLSVSINLGFLGVFKYYNFFAASFTDLLSGFGLHVSPMTLNVILPVGISFYTFHGLSYVIDIYNKKIVAEKNFIDYAVFVSFFPLLVAGPIERATHLLPQIQKARVFDYQRAADGLRQILWGLFKKVVIADNCATFANAIFNNYNQSSGSTLIFGAIFFTFQIYGDFSGYSDIALGVARLFGIDLLRNFAFPYFSRDIAEFWRRWHISLSTWFRDYLYIPLGGSAGSKWVKIRNTFIIFLVSGFWHGANWTFIIWGLLNALYFMPLMMFNKNRVNIEIVAQNSFFPSIKELLQIVTTFGLTVFAWIFFRSDTVAQAFSILREIFSESLLTMPKFHDKKEVLTIIILILFFLIVEWTGRRNQYALEKLFVHKNRVFRWTFYYLLIILLIAFTGEDQEFIYFQF